MSRPLRTTDPGVIHLLGLRTERAELLMTPSEHINELIGGIVARYQETHKIEIFGLVFLSNHYHILCRAPHGNLWKFAQDINREIARRVNWVLAREGKFWGRRYNDQIVLEPADEIEALLYILSNPIRHGLVRHPNAWPGLSSIRQLDTTHAEIYRFTNYTEYRRAKLKNPSVQLEDYTSTHKLTLTPLPALGAKTLLEQKAILEPLLRKEVANAISERRQAGGGFLGVEKIRAQKPQSRAKTTKRASRSPCYTKSRLAKQIFMLGYRCTCAAYQVASRLFRKGEMFTQFPPYTFKPPLHYVPI